MEEIVKKDGKEFLKLLDECKDENEVQDYIEKHSQFIPRKYMENHGISANVVVSKLPIGNKWQTDFAFVSKCSNYWNIVLIEIEDPKKPIFTKDDKFTQAFNYARQQVEEWKNKIRDDSTLQESIKKSLKVLFHPSRMSTNPINFKYVLVYGRSLEINNDNRKTAFNHLANDSNDFTVVTYDRLLSRWENQGSLINLIVSVVDGNKLKMKYVPDLDFESTLFAYVNPSMVVIDDCCKEKLKSHGYDIDSYLNGFALNSNDLHKMQTYNILTKQSEEPLKFNDVEIY